ncbi:MAG TPA: UDP-N-acetylglucosamine 1-carboxyvinyltransferase [Planctomycetota bacterium]|nr:UDP-N-acetylglucosamine 1-carboxyvinyltransferase [Planctomycetota bacterium]
MDRLIVNGGTRLEGRVSASGSKNAVLPCMAAALLTDQPVVLHRVPDLRDVRTMAQILERLGVKCTRDGSTLVMQCTDPSASEAPYDLVSTMRASICVLGPLVARRGQARVSMPGGCVFGVRPVDQHVKGLNLLGAELQVEGGYLLSRVGKRLRGADMFLGTRFGSSVLATANVVMGAVLARGLTCLENAAMEPEVSEVCRLLNSMGASISGVGGHKLLIEGVDELHGAEHVMSGDRIEGATFLVGAAMTRGDVTVDGIDPTQLTVVIETLLEMGASVDRGQDWLRVRADAPPRPVDITTMPYPGFPTDLQAQFMAALCVADGISVVTERIFPDRFMHVAELLRLGADVRKEGPQAIVKGVPRLSGATVMASDLRASAALVLAGLVASGQTEIRRVYHIDRGYERIDDRLRALGGAVRREAQPPVEATPLDW